MEGCYWFESYCVTMTVHKPIAGELLAVPCTTADFWTNPQTDCDLLTFGPNALGDIHLLVDV
ncbi:hypothetical protein JS530_06605 [Bifidobacterium sp. LC6]|uniref:Uncharacterized protein n=1 Tax=Bifidobacterium colobi TaxID=2809026 RepID=A0ABS5UY01_9BIFI|nr:hypothetical protein [Bifidobacterium colobi]MBT1175168.1 hypothetical protein [Bifidobacterium colobi]